MATDNFEFPVQGVTGPGYRNKMASAFNALLTSHKSPGDPPLIVDGMLQVTETTPPTLRVRESDAWVTLMPDLTAPYGGLQLGAVEPPKHYAYATYGLTPIYVTQTGAPFQANSVFYMNFLLDIVSDPDSLFNTNKDYIVPETGWYDVTVSLAVEGPSFSNVSNAVLSLSGSSTDGSNVPFLHDVRAIRGSYFARNTARHYFQQGQVLAPNVFIGSDSTFNCYLYNVHFMVKWSDINLGV